MHWTGRAGFTAQDLDAIHHNKTGALIAAACALGAWAGGADSETAARLKAFGFKLGLAFQIVDDLLDTSAATGKSQGKDAESGKLTYLSLMSRGEAKERASCLTDEAMKELMPFGDQGAALRLLAEKLLERNF
jgi:geranylgeranyl pyrophosphate synthase